MRRMTEKEQRYPAKKVRTYNVYVTTLMMEADARRGIKSGKRNKSAWQIGITPRFTGK